MLPGSVQYAEVVREANALGEKAKQEFLAAAGIKISEIEPKQAPSFLKAFVASNGSVNEVNKTSNQNLISNDCITSIVHPDDTP